LQRERAEGEREIEALRERTERWEGDSRGRVERGAGRRRLRSKRGWGDGWREHRGLAEQGEEERWREKRRRQVSAPARWLRSWRVRRGARLQAALGSGGALELGGRRGGVLGASGFERAHAEPPRPRPRLHRLCHGRDLSALGWLRLLGAAVDGPREEERSSTAAACCRRRRSGRSARAGRSWRRRSFFS
jgi:hypothetical protein